MDTISSQLPHLPAESNDIFSLSDQVLAERLHFIEEIGFGNWGSVWTCQPRPTRTKDGIVRPVGQTMAVKVVHRSKTATTAARVRSLWNEMKVVRSFKGDSHPSIIPFHSFIITPSYALITMTYLPTSLPVEVAEPKARQWFHSLLSAIAFLHKRGVVHNDIKPANILLSNKGVPVLVDFGFAEKYDMDSDTAFHSNLAYGTPEYLAPERARGLPHDTRKSDVWSLGVTFFEILVGRTPFEATDGEQFNTTEDLENYWARTLSGKWVGSWKFSPGVEKLLKRMVAPNADLRCTAVQALADSYWKVPTRKEPTNSHKRASSYNSSIVFEKDMDKLFDGTPARKSDVGRENPLSPPGLARENLLSDDDPITASALKRTLSKSKSQPKVIASKLVQPRKRNPAPPVMDLSPIKASPNSSPYSSATAKENILSFNRLANAVNTDNKRKNQHATNTTGIPRVKDKDNHGSADKEQGNTSTSVASNLMNSVRRPFGALAVRDHNVPSPASAAAARPGTVKVLAKKPSGNTHGMKAVKVLGEQVHNANGQVSHSLDEGDRSHASSGLGSGSTSVRDRVRDWERERERLREMERLEEMERERDEIYKREREQRELNKEKERKMREEEKREREEAERLGFEERQRDSLETKERRTAPHLHIKIPTASGTTRTKLSKSEYVDKENIGASRAASPLLPVFRPTSPLTNVLNIGRDSTAPSVFTRPGKETKQGVFKHSIKASIDKTMQFYKSSIGQNPTTANSGNGRSTPARSGFSFDVSRPPTSQGMNIRGSTKDGKEAWEAEAAGSFPEISPLPVIRNAAESERIAADSRMDRMTIWMRNVEKVVEDAKQNFASSSVMKDTPLPPLPLPLSRGTSQNRTSRLPRRVLAASQIFQADENGNIKPLGDQSMVSNSAYLTADDTSKSSIQPPHTATTANTSVFVPVTPAKSTSPLPEEGSSQPLVIPEIHTPSRQRRATVSTGSPLPASRLGEFVDNEGTSPSKRREKSKSQGDLLQRHIAPISLLEAELMKPPPVEPTPRLSQVLDRNLFIAPLLTSRDNLLDQTYENVREPSLDDLQASPCHVEPYPQRPRRSYDIPVPDTPSRHRIEGVYDRFLMATSGVKRLGKGYQSDNAGPMASANHLGTPSQQQQQPKGRSFYSTRRPMPPPVSSDDQRRAASVDELGMMTYPDVPVVHLREADSGKVTLMRKAMKLIAPKNTAASRRLSRVG